MADARTMPHGVAVPGGPGAKGGAGTRSGDGAKKRAAGRKAKPAPEPVDVQVTAQLLSLRSEVPGIVSSLVATSDGLLVAQDSDLEGAQLAALTSTMTALARHCVETTRGGDLLDAIVRGTNGYLAVFAIGETAVLAVVADPDVTPAWLHVRTRPVVERLLALAGQFDRFYTGAPEAT